MKNVVSAASAATPGVRLPENSGDGLQGDYKPVYRRSPGEKRWYKLYVRKSFSSCDRFLKVGLESYLRENGNEITILNRSAEKVLFGLKVFFNICENRNPSFNSFVLDAPGHSEWRIESNMDRDELLETLSARQKFLEEHHLPYGDAAWAARYLAKVQ